MHIKLIPDTNILIDHHTEITSFLDLPSLKPSLLIPRVVILELDKLKTKLFGARQAIKMIDKYYKTTKINIEGHGSTGKMDIVMENENELQILKQGNDDMILRFVYEHRDFVFLTKDRSLGLKAESFGLGVVVGDFNLETIVGYYGRVCGYEEWMLEQVLQNIRMVQYKQNETENCNIDSVRYVDGYRIEEKTYKHRENTKLMNMDVIKTNQYGNNNQIGHESGYKDYNREFVYNWDPNQTAMVIEESNSQTKVQNNKIQSDVQAKNCKNTVVDNKIKEFKDKKSYVLDQNKICNDTNKLEKNENTILISKFLTESNNGEKTKKKKVLIKECMDKIFPTFKDMMADKKGKVFKDFIAKNNTTDIYTFLTFLAKNYNHFSKNLPKNAKNDIKEMPKLLRSADALKTRAIL